MSGIGTESALRDWRNGQTQSERLAAAVLHIEGFEDVDPQHPLGGADGLKDVLCRKEGLLWVAAVYFPATRPSFTQIRTKFEDDFVGVGANNAQGFVFFVNQFLTVGEREDLIGHASGVRVELYHLERLCQVLNSPKGCGVRLEYLRIAMTEAEQWAFWSTMSANIIRRLADNEARHDFQIRALDEKLNLVLGRTLAIQTDLQARPSSLATSQISAERLEMPTAALSMTTLCWLHRILTERLGLPEAVRGRFRSIQVWIGGSSDTTTYVPPPPEKILDLTSKLLAWWQQRHAELRSAAKPDVVAGLAEFHHRFLHIHPFLDANGRVARCLLDQAARELLNQSIGLEFTKNPIDYYSALAKADEGDLAPLQQRIMASLE